MTMRRPVTKRDTDRSRGPVVGRVRSLAVIGCVAAVLATTVACGSDSDSADSDPAQSTIGAPLAVDTRDTGVGSIVSANEMPLLDRRVSAASSIAARVVYRSTSGIDDSRTEVSSAIFIPSGTPPAGGWPVIALGHGTTGVLGECGPTLDPTLLGISIIASGLVSQGFAVTVSDYQGLGAPGVTEPTHPYLDAATEGMNVIDSVRAARRLSPSVSNRWAALGTSQGGQAVFAANELAGTYAPDLDLLGTAAASPPLDIAPLAQAAAQRKLTEDQRGLMQWMLLVLKHENPNLDLDSYRRGVVESNWDLLSQCSPAFTERRAAVIKEITPDDLTPSSTAATDALTELLARRSLPVRRAAAPILVLYGGRDQLVTPQWTTDAVVRACRLGDTIQSVLQPDRGHADIDISIATSWLQNRFNNRAVVNDCGRLT